MKRYPQVVKAWKKYFYLINGENPYTYICMLHQHNIMLSTCVDCIIKILKKYVNKLMQCLILRNQRYNIWSLCTDTVIPKYQ